MARQRTSVGADEWDRCEAEVLAAVRRMRVLAERGRLRSTAGGAFAPVDVLRGSRGVWSAFWLYAGAEQGAAVDAVVPDLRPLTDVVEGEAAADWDALRALLAGGQLSIRLILPEASVAAGPTRAFVAELTESGIEVRTSDDPSWFFVSRGRVAVVPMAWVPPDPPGGEVRPEDDDVAVVRGGPIVDALSALFEHRWRSAHPWVEGETAGVLRLLASGLDDDAVAATLGISVRTVRRRVAEAMQAYGAATRFELGCRYGRRGR